MPLPSSDNPFFFFFNDTATTEIYTLSLHDALPICQRGTSGRGNVEARHDRHRAMMSGPHRDALEIEDGAQDRKSTRLNSSHLVISYAVFCLKKKNTEPECCITYRRAPCFVRLARIF